MKIGKTWGDTAAILANPQIEVHHIHIEALKRCSWHSHQFRWNAFMVLKGTLYIEVDKSSNNANGYALVDTTELKPGDITTVPPGEVHRFVSGGLPVEAIEIYYPACGLDGIPQGLIANDIARKDVGGDAD